MTSQSPPPATFTTLITVLAQRGLDFVICGGVACVLHGVARVTADLDIAAEMSQKNLRRLVEAARFLELALRIPEPLDALLDEDRRREWIEQKGARVLTLVHADSPLQLDVFLTYPIPFDELKAAADRMTIGGHDVLVCSREHLLRAKRAVDPPRNVDQRDIEDLMELMRREQKR